MKTITIREIAELCEVDERTVQRWAKEAGDKMPSVADKMSAAGHGKAAALPLPETLAIIRSGGKNTLADLLEENARKGEPPKSARIPAGVQLRELRLIYGPSEAAKRLDMLLGYPVASPRPVPLAIEDTRAPDSFADYAFSELDRRFPSPGLPARCVEKAMRSARAAYSRTLDTEAGKVASDRRQEKLF